MIGQTISHYKIISRLGAGGMGIVYEAEDTRLGRKVAIKFLPEEANADAEAIQRFQREARVISNLNHPFICTLYDIGSQGGKQFMVMELLDGQSLKDRIARGALPLEELLELGAQMADALDAAHAQGVVHRDIKPANLFVTRRGLLKVLDFGVAKLGEAGRSSDGPTATMGGADQLTTMGTTIGTVSYMSPEQARGQEIDARSDLFSAGVVLYEMATGQLPFQGPTVATIFESLLTKAPTPPSELKAGIPAELDHIVLKALEKDRAVRYQGAAELRADLKRLKRAADSGMATAVPAAAEATRGRSTVARSAKVEDPPAAAQPGWRKPVLIGAPLLMALGVAGFFFYRSITTPALTQKDSVVLSSVVNRTGDTMFDDTLGEALALQLRQSPFLNVVPEQQLQATLRLMGREPMTPITEELGREICQRAGAKALLGGTIAMLGSSYVLTLNAQDCVDGKVFAEEQAQAPSKETVLQAMGTAVSSFREKLGETLASIQRYDAKIEQGTTSSLEALKAYSQGLRTRRTTGDFDSVPFFRRAIDLDPQFALAYARLGTVYANLGQGDESRKMTTKAYELRERVSEAERYYIEARYYTTVQIDVQKALDVYKVWLATYPADYTALTNSALLHKQQGDRAEAIRKLELATKTAPDQPSAFTNLGQTYFEAAQYADAKKAYETAILLQDSTGARVGLYQIGILTGDQALADQQVSAVEGRRDEVDMVAIRMFAATYRGRMKEAAQLATDFQARALALSRPQAAGNGIMQLAISEALVGLIDQAKARIDKAEDDGILDDNTIDDRMVVAALAGDAATAHELSAKALEAQKKVAKPGPGPSEIERAVEALEKLAEGKAAEAVAVLEPVSFRSSHTDTVNIWSVAKMRAGDWAAAEKGLTFMNSPEARGGLSATTAYVHLALARVQRQLGKTSEARASYQKFFEIFKDADPDLPLLLQAKEEFGKLGS
ncbi:MAG TPA: protein kinase [Vicinamibacterales bacterium]|nr:protein kinase [Vicinamibacterales bacterium]